VFGENYAQELIEKAPQMPDDVCWHFIGHLQSNKARALVAGVPNLACLETLDSQKLANKLDAACAECHRADPLRVMLQVNTSGEESKFGLPPGEACLSLARHVVDACPRLQLAGLMTIGQPDYTSEPENFLCLARCRDELCTSLQLPKGSLELSMGMSGDFEQAIKMGSGNVRVGSTIFGAREYPNKK
jgi:pyridoxal phosphate enzyme (YggS family)